MSENSRHNLKKCETCGKEFTQQSSLNRHQRHTHDHVKAHSCSKCSLSFAQKTNLLSHLQRAHALPSPEKSAHPCAFCTCIFSKLNVLKRHEKNCQKRNSLVVIERNDTLAAEHEHDPDALAQFVVQQLKHLQNSLSAATVQQTEAPPNAEKPATCPLVALMEDTAADTQVVELVDKLYPDGVLKTVNVQTVQRNKHARSSFVCDFCAKEFRKTYDFIRHRRTHTNERPYACSNCPSRFNTKAKLCEHQRRHILNERTGLLLHQHSCPVCTDRFKSQRHLKEHMRYHGERTKCSPPAKDIDDDLRSLERLLPTPLRVDVKYSVPQHQDSTTSAQSNNTDSERVHKLQFFRCTYCPRLFKNKHACELHLKRHLRELLDMKGDGVGSVNTTRFKDNPIKAGAAHKAPTAATKLACRHCSKVFGRSGDLRRHLRTHTLERPYACPICPKTFALRGTLRDHQRIHATGTSNAAFGVACQVCAKSYTTRKALTVHLRLHTDERPFLCDYCGKTFRTSGHRLSHMRRRSTAKQRECTKQTNICL